MNAQSTPAPVAAATRLSLSALRNLSGAPCTAFVHVLGEPVIVGVQRRGDGSFEFEPVYRVNGKRQTETELLLNGGAVFRVRIDRFTMRDYSARRALATLGAR